MCGFIAARIPLAQLWLAIRDLPVLGSGDPAHRVGRRVERVGARVPGAHGCYPQALAASVLLKRHGHRPELVIGIRNRPFGAHAWVEVQGQIVTGALQANDYREIWRGSA